MSGGTTTAVTAQPTTGLELRSVTLADPLAGPMLTDLAREYAHRYADLLGADAVRAELARYPAAEFLPPSGDLVLALAPGPVAVAGGAFRRRTAPELGDDARRASPHEHVPTAELKRIWTHPDHRRRGHAARLVAELEHRAAAAGYRRVYLTTGPRQPEAVGLYVALGYTPLFDRDIDPESIGPLPFEKWLCPA